MADIVKGHGMNLYTSYFARVKKLQEMGFKNLVCVAGYAPKFFYDNIYARFMPELAPHKKWWREWHDRFKDEPNSPESIAWYRERYIETVLSKLDPGKTLEKLGDNAVMLCYEKYGDFCHRHLIADWLNSSTDAKVVEIQM